jgi:hypothetical protein
MKINLKTMIKIEVLLLTFILLLSGCHLMDEDRILETEQTIEDFSASIQPEITSAQQVLPTSKLTTTPPITPSVTEPTFTPTTSPANTPANTPTYTLSASPTVLPFKVQPDSPAYIQNFAHPQESCNWSGVAGQVFDETGNAIKRVVVLIQGQYGNKNIDSVTLTGLKTAEKYGPGGYEIYLGDQPISTNGTLSIQLFDLDANPISDVIPLITYDECSKNLIIINFSFQQ